MAAKRAKDHDRISGALCKYGYIRKFGRDIEEIERGAEYAVKRITDYYRVFAGTGG